MISTEAQTVHPTLDPSHLTASVSTVHSYVAIQMLMDFESAVLFGLCEQQPGSDLP